MRKSLMLVCCSAAALVVIGLAYFFVQRGHRAADRSGVAVSADLSGSEGSTSAKSPSGTGSESEAGPGTTKQGPASPINPAPDVTGQPMDPREVAAQTSMDDAMHARAKALAGNPPALDKDEFGLGERSWQALAHALAHKDPRILLAKTLLGEGNYDAAIAMLAEILASEPDSDVCSLAHLMTAIALTGKGDWPAACAQLKYVIENYPRSAAVLEAAERLSFSLFLLGKTLDGINWAVGLLEADPTNEGARMAMWRLMCSPESRFISEAERNRRWEICMAAMGQAGNPIEAYDAALAMAKSMATVDRTKMFELLQEVARYCPDPTIAANAKAEILERLVSHDPLEAIRLGEDILASSADEAIKKQARRMMVDAYAAAGNIEMAQELFDQVIMDGWSSDNLAYFLNSALCSVNLNEADGAKLIAWLDDLATRTGMVGQDAMRWSSLLAGGSEAWAQQRDSFSFRDLTAFGSLCLAVGNYELAEEVGRQFMSAYEKDFSRQMDAVDIVAAAMVGQGEYNEAVDLFQKTLSRFEDQPAEAEWEIRLADYLKLAGRCDEALKIYEGIVTASPESIDAQRALYLAGETQRTVLDDLAAARATYEQLISKYPDSVYADCAREQLALLGAA